MSRKVGFISLGCAKNLVDSEEMLARLDAAGYQVTGEIENTDAVVVNTCGFLQSAKEEAAEYFKEISLLKDEGKIGKLIVAGCLAEREKEELFNEFPEIDALVGCGSFSEIAEVCEETLNGQRPARFGDINAPICEQSRMLTTPQHTAFLKIAEGCDNRCSYCVIPTLRGKFRSRPIEDVLSEAEALAQEGVKELILVAQDTTRYGTDLYGELKLSELLRELCRVEGIKWIRVHYMYPDEIDDELIKTIAEEEKIVKYLDLPIQHVNDRILKAMNRRGDGAYLDTLFTKLRREIPGLVLRTSLIAGLPGETDEEFTELCDFLRKHRIERAGVFPYSPEPGSLAAEMPDQVDEETKSRRCEIIADLQAQIMADYNETLIGKEICVLCEGYDRYSEAFFGRTFADSPEVDGKVFFTCQDKKKPAPGAFVTVRIDEDLDGDPIGEFTGFAK